MADDFPPGTPGYSQRECERHAHVVDFGGRDVAQGPCQRDGRPVRHTTYVFPRGRHGIFGWSLLAAGLLAIALPQMFLFARPTLPQAKSGLRSALSPGPTSNVHTLTTFDCAQCHRSGRGTESVRCERCHDASISARLSNAAHVFRASGDLRQAVDAPTVECAVCHLEHRGETFRAMKVDDGECASCHRVSQGSARRLSDFARHPEFALVGAGTESGSGLRWFSHEIHLKQVTDALQKAAEKADASAGAVLCTQCHDREKGAPGFTPISFDRHCASCHRDPLRDKTAQPVAAAVVAALAPPARISSDLAPTLQKLTGVTHADPWVMASVQSLAAAANPDGVGAERFALDRQVAQLELMVRYGADEFIRTWNTAGRTPRAYAESPASPGDVNRASVAMQALGLRAGMETAQLSMPVKSAASSTPSSTPATPGAGDSRTATLRLLEATVARATGAGNQDLVQRATALQKRIQELPVSAGAARTEAPLQTDGLLRQLGRLPDPRARAEARDNAMFSATAAALQRRTVDPTAFDIHRQHTLALLEASEEALIARQTGGAITPAAEGVLADIDRLRRRVLGSFFGLPEALGTRRDALYRQRQQERARVDGELDALGIRTPGPNEPEDAAVAQWRARLTQLQRRLNAFASARALPTAIGADKARAAIAALIGTELTSVSDNKSDLSRCTLCHELTPGGLGLAPVRSVGGSLLVNSRFNHEPHLTAEGRNCTTTCHMSIPKSSGARDVNIPGVESCRTCHAPRQQAASVVACQACHTYHAGSTSALMWTP